MPARCGCGAQLFGAAGHDTATIALRPKTQTRTLRSSPRGAQEAGRRFPRDSSRQTARDGAQIDDNATLLRRKMFAWLHGPGRKLRQPLNGSTNYLGAYDSRGELIRQRDAPSRNDVAAGPARQDMDGEDPLEIELELERQKQHKDVPGKGEKTRLPPESGDDLRPFPLNRHFRSQPVLSEAFREEIWRRVRLEGQEIQLVSSGMGVSVERVAAVVRLKEVEKRWQQEGKPLATPYNKAVLAMLPTTPFDPSRPLVGHESINDLRVTSPTKAQLFHPVSESRAFTREDAGTAFEEGLLPADERIPHPELVLAEKDRLGGMSAEAQAERAAERMRLRNERRQETLRRRQQTQQRETKVVSAGRWDFMFREMNAEAVGPDGRSETAVGWRYGVPHQDRKKGQVKIPTRVL